MFGKANVHLTSAVGECPVGESHIGELPATRKLILTVQNIKKLSIYIYTAATARKS
jgi:hypothetical protein